jgi:hypothetical protein
MVEINQNNFSNGTYRITQPGEYILMEDILFNPYNKRDDEPFMGWFCIISIESD